MTMASAENSSSSITSSVTLQLAPLSDERVRIKTLRDAERDCQIFSVVKTDAICPSSCLITCLLQGPRMNGAVDKNSLQFEEITKI